MNLNFAPNAKQRVMRIFSVMHYKLLLLCDYEVVSRAAV